MFSSVGGVVGQGKFNLARFGEKCFREKRGTGSLACTQGMDDDIDMVLIHITVNPWAQCK